SPPTNSVILLRSIVVVTTFILPARTVVKIPSNEIKKKISLFFMLSSLKFLKLILMCTVSPDHKYPSQPCLVIAFSNIIICCFPLQFDLGKFCSVPAGRQRVSLFYNVFIIWFLRIIIAARHEPSFCQLVLEERI